VSDLTYISIFFAELQTDKTSTEVNIEVIAKEDEPTRKISKMAKSIGYIEKTEEEPKKVTYVFPSTFFGECIVCTF
jgi:hypothetical protein